MMNNIIEMCIKSNTITNKDLFESLKKYTQQSEVEINMGINSKSQFTLPTKATGEDQSMSNQAIGRARINNGKDDTQKNEAQLLKEAHSNLAQQ